MTKRAHDARATPAATKKPDRRLWVTYDVENAMYVVCEVENTAGFTGLLAELTKAKYKNDLLDILSLFVDQPAGAEAKLVEYLGAPFLSEIQTALQAPWTAEEIVEGRYGHGLYFLLSVSS